MLLILVDGFYDMSRVMRKPTFCTCENKDEDQLRGNVGFLMTRPICVHERGCEKNYMSHVMRKPDFFAYEKSKAQISSAVTAQLFTSIKCQCFHQ